MTAEMKAAPAAEKARS
ncbi:hypothetical protein A2U01_0089382, partial [Trifolium medium]|nr:hypothetical protein [Trifolium medium]